jgi:hypothetical protein
MTWGHLATVFRPIRPVCGEFPHISPRQTPTDL